MKDKKIYIALCVSILLVGVGVSLAYFGIKIIGNDTAKGNKVVTGNLELTFTDTNEITLNDAFPGDSFTKTISVKNTGTKDVSYNLVWTELTNGIINNELVIEATCKQLNASNSEEGTCSSISQKAVSSDSNITSNIPIKPGYTHEYTVKITFIDTGKPQNYNKNKTFEGKLGITESSAKTVYCTYDGELTQGAEYVNGQYTYRYMQEGTYVNSGLAWRNITSDGWGVQLTDKASTDAVTSKVCTYINNAPITSMSYIFRNSQATTIDVSNFDTSNVTNMGYMFNSSKATTLDISNFDTSKVTNMGYMFSNSQATTLDVSNFDTSNVTNMGGMFQASQATTLDISNFDTSKVTNMGYMFSNSQATTLDVSNFDTSKVTNMTSMFEDSQATTIDVSNFDTSKVTYMGGMFEGSQATTIDVSNFDTSKVTNMSGMFQASQATTLDVSNFDTSNVTNMSAMFYSSTNLKTIYVSNKFNTDKVTSSINMFTGSTNLVGGAGTKYNGSHVDKTYARIDGGTSNPGYFTDVADKPSTFSTDSWKTIAASVKAGNTRGYKVGETKTIDMGTYGTHTLRIANTSTPSECSTAGFSQTACGFVLEFADIITKHKQNDPYTNVGGWPATIMRTFVNTDIYNAIPSEIKNAIIGTKVVSGHGSKDTANFTSTDKLYLLSTAEVWAQGSSNTTNTITTDAARDVTRQLDYYKNLGVTTDNYSGAIKKNGTSADYWLLRAAFSINDSQFYSVDDLGNWDSNDGDDVTIGVAPAFRLG